MDRRERNGDPVESTTAAFEGLQTGLWTALPGIIQSFDGDKQTAVVQPAIKARVQSKQGVYSWISLPPLVDCPVYFPQGGGVALTFPISTGDECLVIFASRCIDAWWQSGGEQVQADIRMHDLSDGFVFAGVASLPNVFGGVSGTAAELRTRAGTAKVAVAKSGAIDITSPSAVTVTAPTINLNGTVNITGTLMINGEPYLDHIHSNGNGGANTGGVV